MYEKLLDNIEVSNLKFEQSLDKLNKSSGNGYNESNVNPFSVDKLTNLIFNKLSKQYYNDLFNSTDILECFQKSVFKKDKVPIPSIMNQNNFLKLEFKKLLGNAIHKFIQENYSDFTEIELKLIVPSINVSIRLDALIGNSILIEIKSCESKKYHEIISSTFREKDLLQALLYKYVLENYYDEIKKSTNLKYINYDIKTIQLIYICNDFGTLQNNEFIKIFTLDLSKLDITKQIDDIKQRITFLNNQSTDKIDFFLKKDECIYCNWNKLCDK